MKWNYEEITNRLAWITISESVHGNIVSRPSGLLALMSIHFSYTFYRHDVPIDGTPGSTDVLSIADSRISIVVPLNWILS